MSGSEDSRIGQWGKLDCDSGLKLFLSEFWNWVGSLNLSQIKAWRWFLYFSYSPLTSDKCCRRGEEVTLGRQLSLVEGNSQKRVSAVSYQLVTFHWLEK